MPAPHQWGRSPDAGRQPSRLPVYTLTLLPLALASGIGLAAYQYQVGLTVLQRWYLPAFIASTYAPRLPVSLRKTHGTYQLVDLVDDRYVAQPTARYDNATLEPWLRETVYGGRTVQEFVRDGVWWPMAGAGGVLLVGLFLTIPLDRARAQIIRDGKILRGGPRPRTVAEFNRHHRTNDGIRIQVEP